MGKTSREKNFLKSTFILAFGTFLPKLASFITLPIYTGELTKDEYGTFDLITVLCTLLLPVATLQVQSAVFRFLVDYRDNREKQNAIITLLYVFVIPISIVVLIILYFALYKLSPFLRILIIIYYFADILLAVTRQVARGLSKNHIYSVSAIINSFLNMILVIILLVYYKTGLNGLVASLTVSATVSFVYIFVALKTWQFFDTKRITKKLFKQIIGYSWPMVPNSISLWIVRMSDRLIILAYMGAAANAIYAAANKIPTLLQLAQNTFSMAWSESASLTIKDKDADQYYTQMFRILHRVLAGFAAMLMAVQPLLFRILIRGDYAESYIHISILIIGSFFSNIAVYLGGIYIANMRTKSIGITTVISAALNFIINILFIKKIGVFAATLSTAISYLFLMVYRLIDVRKFQKIQYPIMEMVITNLILIGMCIMCGFRTVPFYCINLVIGCVMFVVLNKELLIKTKDLAFKILHKVIDKIKSGKIKSR